jgi:molybdopterin-guanine dinucleotide biosynthesis protein A
MILKETSGKLNGIVLAGGKSSRMGQDKGSMRWHGVEQRYYMAGLLKEVCDEVFISCREEQQMNGEGYPLITDSFTDAGPLVGILSAFKTNPEAAWLVVACDLPLLDEVTLRFLKEHRDMNAIATSFESPHDGLPEPLVAIWEPAAFPYLLEFLGEGYKCPRKALITHPAVTLLKAPDPEALMNTNTPEDAARAAAIINKTSIA